MAYTKPTLATLKQSLADRHDGGDLPTDSTTIALWVRIFNRGVQYCINKLKITKSAILTTVGKTVALPDDFIRFERVLDSDGNSLSLITAEESGKATGLVYWITGNFADGFYLNTLEDKTYTVYYAYRPSPMSDDADICPFPDEEAIVSYAYGMIRNSESNPFDDSGQALAEVDARLREIASDYNINEQPLGFKLAKNA